MMQDEIKRVLHAAVLKAWEDAIGPDWVVTAADLMHVIARGADERVLTARQGRDRLVIGAETASKLRQALQDICYHSTTPITARGIGRYLGDRSDVAVNGLRIKLFRSPKGNKYVLARESGDEIAMSQPAKPA